MVWFFSMFNDLMWDVIVDICRICSKWQPYNISVPLDLKVTCDNRLIFIYNPHSKYLWHMLKNCVWFGNDAWINSRYMFKAVFVFNLNLGIKGRTCPICDVCVIFFYSHIYLSVINSTYCCLFLHILFFFLDLENDENTVHVSLQRMNGAIPIVGGYLFFHWTRVHRLKTTTGHHRYSVAINQVMIIKILPFLNCSAQFKILNYNYIYYTNFNTH